jgi:MobA-like NTP transferase protein
MTTDNSAVGDVTGFINAGGRGTRLNSLFRPTDRGVCKALLRVGDPPITLIEHQINKLHNAGFRTIVVNIGDHVEAGEFVAARYSGLGRVHVVGHAGVHESGGALLGTIRTRPELFGTDVYIVCQDTLLDIDENALVGLHRSAEATLTIGLSRTPGVPNEGAYYVGPADRVLYTAEVREHSITPEQAMRHCLYRATMAAFESCRPMTTSHPRMTGSVGSPNCGRSCSIYRISESGTTSGTPAVTRWPSSSCARPSNATTAPESPPSI